MITKSEGMMVPGKLKWYIILALALWLAFSGVAAAEQLYVNESCWWRDGGAFNASTAPIQAAVGAAAAGDSIYVYGGRYNENVNAGTSRLTLVGEGADVVTVTAANSGDHVFEVTKDYVNISGFTVTGATGSSKAGIYLNGADHCNISENNASNNGRGICLESSSNNTLVSNTANSNDWGGIYLVWSSNNMLVSNKMSGNAYNFGVFGCSLSEYTQNIDTSNTVDGKSIYYWVDQKDWQIPSDAGFVGVVNGTNITVRDLTLTDNWEGLLFAYTENSKIENVTVSSNFDGIYLYSSSNNTLASNTALDNYNGVALDDSSNNTLTGNTANSNNDDGIQLDDSSNNTLVSNTANSNNEEGIQLSFSSDNTLTGNTANSNNDDGILLYNSSNNNITCNWVQDNAQYGFHLSSGSTDNIISYNNIIENGNYNATTGGWEWQFYDEQSNPVEAKHNYWGAGMNNSTIDASIYDDDESPYRGEVKFYPFETEPVPCAPGPKRPAFTTTDAVIALQIAVGSRPSDPRWDVSGDGSVTSLDALMILQAAAGKSEGCS